MEQSELVRQELERLKLQDTGDTAAPAMRSGGPRPPAPSAVDDAIAALSFVPPPESPDAQDSFRGGEPEPYFADDPGHSLLQSVMEEYMRSHHHEHDAGDLRAFTETDPDWIRAISVALAYRLERGRRDFVGDTPPTIQLSHRARVILVGDWGLGEGAALAVGALMRSELESAGDRQTHAVHLGDVYYAGTEWEAENRFLAHWPVRSSEADTHMSWALNGNHDMFSGGYGYFDHVLADPRFARQSNAAGEPISFFRLANEHWQVLGLDTAWDDHILTSHGAHGFLRKPQPDWIRKCIADDPARSTVLLSHHQFVSRHAEIDGNLADMVGPIVETHGIEAWFWGHEHRCQRFAPRPGLPYSACLGHGAVPVALGDARPEPEGWEFDEGPAPAGRAQPTRRMCGFCVLDFDGPALTARYIDEAGSTFATETVPPRSR